MPKSLDQTFQEALLYLRETKDGVTLSVRVTPNSAKDALERIGEDRLGVRLKAPPVEGKANKELIKFLAKKLGVSPSYINIVHGLSSREKVLLIHHLDMEAISKSLEDAL